MPFITVNQGGPPPDQDIDDGVYQVYLEKVDGPKGIIPKFGENAGKEVFIFDWLYIIEGGDFDGRELQATTSTASGPRSKMYSWLTALFGGKPPAVGANFEKDDLIGLRALATVAHGESGWPKLENLGAMPSSMRQAAPAAQVASPAVPAARRAAPPPPPTAAPAEETTSSALPF